MIHFFASTGARPNAINDSVLRFEHISPMLLGCKAVLLYSGSNEEYWTFLTPEASKALDDYIDFRIHSGKKITKYSPVFVAREKQGKYCLDSLSHLTATTLHSLFLTILKNAKIFNQGRLIDTFTESDLHYFDKISAGDTSEPHSIPIGHFWPKTM